ncbi:MAG: hypothetical protein JST46_01790 [Bacteroidetes bacterium]|nr:hypothetical protein [Bacteroidota bacterium]
MKNFISTVSIIALFLSATSCAVNKAAGSWDYSVTGTPQGDYSGVMVITQDKTGYAGKLTGQTGEIPFDKVSYDKKQGKLSGNFYFSGYPLSLTATVIKDAMKGSISTGDMEFPLTANRKK